MEKQFQLEHEGETYDVFAQYHIKRDGFDHHFGSEPIQSVELDEIAIFAAGTRIQASVALAAEAAKQFESLEPKLLQEYDDTEELV